VSEKLIGGLTAQIVLPRD